MSCLVYTEPRSAIHCNTLQHTATHCNTLQQRLGLGGVLAVVLCKFPDLWHSLATSRLAHLPQRTATHYAPQHTFKHSHDLQHSPEKCQLALVLQYNALQCYAVNCNAVQPLQPLQLLQNKETHFSLEASRCFLKNEFLVRII